MEEKVEQNFKEIREIWGSEYEITDGEYKGYRISLKVIATKIRTATGKLDAEGNPIFKISSKVL